MFEIIPCENCTNTNRVSFIQVRSVRRYIKAAQIRPPCVVGMEIWGKSKPVIKWLEKWMFKGLMYENGVF